jgi:hypothetical protein
MCVERAERRVVVGEHLRHYRFVIVCQLHLRLRLGTAWFVHQESSPKLSLVSRYYLKPAGALVLADDQRTGHVG